MSARLLVLTKFLQVLACSDFRYAALPRSVRVICILKTKTDPGNYVSRVGNWETLEEHTCALNACFWNNESSFC